MLSKQILYDLAKQKADRAISQLNGELLFFKVSHQRLSEVSHVDKGNLSKILSGVVYPNFKTWCRILVSAEFLCHPEWFESSPDYDTPSLF